MGSLRCRNRTSAAHRGFFTLPIPDVRDLSASPAGSFLLRLGLEKGPQSLKNLLDDADISQIVERLARELRAVSERGQDGGFAVWREKPRHFFNERRVLLCSA